MKTMPSRWMEILKDMKELEADNRELKMKLADAQDYAERIEKRNGMQESNIRILLSQRDELSKRIRELEATVEHLETLLDEERRTPKEVRGGSLEEKLAEVIEKVLERNGLL
ncbi:hypothetical protein NX029_26325 [Cytobacillus firmus]|nr:hypothetical protein [Cytobacillus firmus]